MKLNKNRLVSVILALVMVVSVCAFVGCSDKESANAAGYKAVIENYFKELDTDFYGYVSAQKGKLALKYDDVLKEIEADSALMSDGLDQKANSAKDDALASVADWEKAYAKDTYAINIEYVEEKEMAEKTLKYQSSVYTNALKRDVKVEAGCSVKCKVTFGEGETAVVRDYEFTVFQIAGKWYIEKAVDVTFNSTEAAVKAANDAAAAIKKDIEAQKKLAEEAAELVDNSAEPVEPSAESAESSAEPAV